MPWPLVLIAGFLIPGAGHFAYGERRRGVLIGSAVILLFLLGILISGIRVVEFPDMNAPGNLLSRLLTSPTFDCAAFTGPMAFVAGWISQGYANGETTALFVAHARLYDIGGLYIGVAGGLNLLALVDCVGRAMAGSPPRDKDGEAKS